MLTNDDFRRAFGRPDMTDAEIDEFRSDLRAFFSQFLDAYFREEFEPDD